MPANKPKPKRAAGRPRKLSIEAEVLEKIATRPATVDIDERMLKMLKGLAEIDCTNYEMAVVLGVSESTWTDFRKRHPALDEFIEASRVNGNVSLRRTQKNVAKERIKNTCQNCGKIVILDMAYEGAFLDECPYCKSPDVTHTHMPADRAMMVWLGKQTLGQRDNLDTRISGDPDGAPLVFSTLADFVRNQAKKDK